MAEPHREQLEKLLERERGLLSEYSQKVYTVTSPIERVNAERERDIVRERIRQLQDEIFELDYPYPEQVSRAMYKLYKEMGEATGVLGKPEHLTPYDKKLLTFTNADGNITTGYCKPFEKGTIYWNDETNSAVAVYGRIGEFYEKQKGINTIGFPVSKVIQTEPSPQGTIGVYQCFQGVTNFRNWMDGERLDYGATIYSSEKFGTYLITGGFGEYYENEGGTYLSFGFPISPKQVAEPSPKGTKGYYQRFEGGMFYSENPNSSAMVIILSGAVLELFENLGGTSGKLGFPVLEPASRNIAKFLRYTKTELYHFEDGIILEIEPKAIAFDGFVIGHSNAEPLELLTTRKQNKK